MKTKVVVVAIIAVIALVGVYFAVQGGIVCWPNEEWYVITNEADKYNVWSAGSVRHKYGCQFVGFYEITDEQLNAEGQSLIFIGGSEEFAGRVPWAETWPSLTVLQPMTWPDVYFANDGTWNNWWIHTPHQDFYCAQNSQQIHDLGLIAKAYDSTLKRWIVICIGYSAFATGAGATIINEHIELLQINSWLVYEVDINAWSANQDINEWNSALLQASIVATG